ncbi:MAG: hypothetical protein ACFFF4_13950 [Candidatus Thorarchaeota archaeon]
MISWRRNDILKVVILVPLALVSTYLAIATANIVSLTETTRLSVHSLFVYWACVPLAVTLVTLRKKYTISKLLFTSAFLFFILARVFSAINSLLLLGSDAVITHGNILARSFEITIFSVLLFVATLTSRRVEFQFSLSWKLGMGILLLSIPPSLSVIFYFIFVPMLSSSAIVSTSLVLFSLTLLVLILTPILWQRNSIKEISIDSGYFLTGSLLLIIAAGVMMLAITNQFDLWVIGENIQIASFFVFGLSFCVPFLRRRGFQRITSYTIYIVLGIVSYLPLLVTTVLESLNLTQSIGEPNILAYGIIHTGVGSLSLMMAFLVYAYSRIRLIKIQNSLIPVFVVWSSVAIASFLAYQLPLIVRVGETIIPYLVGGLLTVYLLLTMQSSTQVNSDDKSSKGTTQQIILRSLLCFSFVIISDIIDQLVYGWITTYNLIGLGQVLLLLSNYTLMLSLAYIILLLAEEATNSISFEMYVISFIIFWILPSTLKNFYPIWSTGWWLSEILFFIGVLVGPAILSFLYIQAMRDMNESHSRAKLYADLLMHDITNYNQMALTTMELLASGQLTKEETDRVISDAQRAVEIANQLISNVRLLNETEGWMGKTLFTIDLVKSVVRTVDLVTKSQRYPERIIRLSSETVHAYALGNEFLDYALINFLYTALSLPSKDREILLTVNPTSNFDEKWWSIQLDIPDVSYTRTGYDPIDESLHQRIEQTLEYQVSKLIIEQMDGYVEVQRTIDEDSVCILMSMNLPFSHEED